MQPGETKSETRCDWCGRSLDLQGRAITLHLGLAALNCHACDPCVKTDRTERPPEGWTDDADAWQKARNQAAARVQLWSSAIAAHDVLEPWFTEAALDDWYWDDVASRVVARVAPEASHSEQRGALVEALESCVGSVDPPRSSVYRDDFDSRVDLILASVGLRTQ